MRVRARETRWKRIGGSAYPGEDGAVEMMINWVSRALMVGKWGAEGKEGAVQRWR